MPDYTHLVDIESSSSNRLWPVSTDGEQLTCSCPAWTQSTHYPSCPRVTGAHGTCRCKEGNGAVRSGNGEWRLRRTCPHVRQMQPIIDVIGLERARSLARQGRIGTEFSSWQREALAERGLTPYDSGAGGGGGGGAYSTTAEVMRRLRDRIHEQIGTRLTEELQNIPPTRQRARPVRTPPVTPATPVRTFTPGQRNIRIRDDD